MATHEHKYVSLKDVLTDISIPKLESSEPNFIESQEEVEFEHLSKNSRNPKFPSSPSFGSLCDMGKTKTKAKKKGLGGRFSCLKLSRSDDPLVYVERHDEEEEEDDDDAFDELEALSQEMKNVSWKERMLKSTLFSEYEEEEEEEEEDKSK